MSLALQGKKIPGQSAVLLNAAIADKIEQDELEKLKYEIERFNIWAISLGLQLQGHGSLDYRLRDSEKLIDHVQRLLDNLHGVLELGEISILVLIDYNSLGAP